jgi:hypothetical protein
MASRGPNQCFGQGLRSEGQRQKLASARAHTANQQSGIRFFRVDHHGCRAVAAETLYQIERIFRIAVQIDDNNVVVMLQQSRHIVEVRVERILPDRAALRLG